MNIRVPFCNELPDAIIVGIGYPTSGSLAENYAQVMHLRMRDFLPARDEGAEQFIQEQFPVPDAGMSGGAGQFLQFIHQELTPWLESQYRIDATDRTVMGHSWGGVFALYTLFRHPHLFQRYVVVSGNLPFDDDMEYSKKHASLPVRMYLASGEAEMGEEGLSKFNAFIGSLNARQYAGFRLNHQVIANCTHCAVVAPAFLAGLLAVFA